MSFFIKQDVLKILKAFILPFLMAIYPVLFLYGNNVTILLLPSLQRTLLFYSTIGALFFGIFCFFFKGRVIKAANATFIFLIFFNIYGIVFDFLLKQDLFLVAHYSMLPLFILLAVYITWYVAKVGAANFWNGSLIVMSTLVVFNLIKIVPIEVEKYKKANEEKVTLTSIESSPANSEYPDIYFIIFDEFAGFDTMRAYWNYHGVNDFIDFAKSKGFFVAENSRASSIGTLHQMAERLNYQEYEVAHTTERVHIYDDYIVHNKAMQYLKSKGYSTVVFDETGYFLENTPPIESDYSFGYDSEMNSVGLLFDQFGVLVADNTMLKAFSRKYKILDPTLEQHREWIYFTVDKMADLNDIPSPKFVHVHFILPHTPFMFTENGAPVDPKYHYNWNYYLGNYKFSIKIMKDLIDNILSNADPNNQPVIIIQSDHGARNIKAGPDSVAFEDYPEKYKSLILNIMYLPGYEISQLPQNIKPINTFPIVFNHYFNEDIPLK